MRCVRFGQVAYGLSAKLSPTELSGDLINPARRYALEHHLHQCRHQSSFRPLIAFEQPGRGGPVSIATYFQLQEPNPPGQGPLGAPTAVDTQTRGPFTMVSSKGLGHLCLQNLDHHLAQKHFGSLVADLWLRGGSPRLTTPGFGSASLYGRFDCGGQTNLQAAVALFYSTSLPVRPSLASHNLLNTTGK